MSVNRSLRLATTVLTASILTGAGCGTMFTAPRASDAAIAAVSDRLFFGTVIATGGAVTNAEWTTFVDDVISPRLPEGFAVSRADGQWRDASGSVRRDSGFTLEVIHPPGSPADSVFASIASEYCRRFHQE